MALSELAGKTALVTGGAGFIGSNLVRALLANDVEKVIVIDTAVRSFAPNILDDHRVLVLRSAITDRRLFIELHEMRKPDYIFHLAAHFANQKSLDDPEKNLMVNGLGTLRTLEYARQRDVPKVIFASSGCAMAGNREEPMVEDDITLKLDSPYQITKMLGELYFNFYHSRYGVPISICRYFNVYGPGELPGKYRNVIPNFAWRAIHGDTLPIMGTGKETRDYTYVGDIVNGTLLAATTPAAVGGTFNMASGVETPTEHLAEALYGMEWRKKVYYLPKRPWDTTVRRRASIERAREVLGYAPQTDLFRGIVNTVDWMRKNQSEIRAFLGE